MHFLQSQNLIIFPENNLLIFSISSINLSLFASMHQWIYFDAASISTL